MKEYNFQKYFTYEGHRYKVVGDTLEEVLEKKIKIYSIAFPLLMKKLTLNLKLENLSPALNRSLF